MRNKLKALGDSQRVPIDRYLSDLPSPQKEICISLRSLMQRLHVGVEETLKWGYPCYSYQGKNLASLMPAKQCVDLALFRGADLDDPEGVVEGCGSEMRYVRFHSAHDLNKPTIEHLVRQAMELGASATPEVVAVGEDN